jgi:two-component system phosphate regulon sensor histidine kinase PhoR
VPGYPGYGVTIRPGRLEHLQAQRRASIRMFAAEGTTFLCILVAGTVLILRSVRREMELMRQQANFLSAVTHELKSPLASIRLFIETLELRDPPPEKRARFLANMRGDVDRLDGLVNNILAVARLDSGRFVVHVDRGDLGRDVADVVEALGKIPRNAVWPSISLCLLSPCSRAMTWACSRPCCATCWTTPPSTAAPSSRCTWPWRGRATGPSSKSVTRALAWPPRSARRSFQKFYRVGEEMVRQTEGTGLGLYLARELIRQLGGSITADSPGVGKGSTFRVSLPLDREEQA